MLKSIPLLKRFSKTRLEHNSRARCTFLKPHTHHHHQRHTFLTLTTRSHNNKSCEEDTGEKNFKKQHHDQEEEEPSSIKINTDAQLSSSSSSSQSNPTTNGLLFPQMNSYVKIVSPQKNRIYVIYLCESTNKKLTFNEGPVMLDSILSSPFGTLIPTMTPSMQTQQRKLMKKQWKEKEQQHLKRLRKSRGSRTINGGSLEAEDLEIREEESEQKQLEEDEQQEETNTDELESSSHHNNVFLLLPATMEDIVQHGKRYGQVIYTKDAAQIVHRLNIGPGSRVLEAGSGSSHFTQVLAWRVGSTGKVFTFEAIKDSYLIAKKNMERSRMIDNVEMHQEMLTEETLSTNYSHIKDLDAVFLDMKDPSTHIRYVHKLMKPGSILGLWLPTTNQVSDALKVLEETRMYACIKVQEIMERNYKSNYARFRPEDRMIAHTGYMVFATALHPNAGSFFLNNTTRNENEDEEAPDDEKTKLLFDGFFNPTTRRSANVKKNGARRDETQVNQSTLSTAEGDST